jgi:hypothetical protein
VQRQEVLDYDCCKDEDGGAWSLWQSLRGSRIVQRERERNARTTMRTILSRRGRANVHLRRRMAPQRGLLAAEDWRQEATALEGVGPVLVLQPWSGNPSERWRCMHGGSTDRQGRPPKAAPSNRITSRWPMPLPPPVHLAPAIEILQSWATKRGAIGIQLRRILGCLD